MKINGKILAVDDDPNLLRLLQSYLKDSPFQLTVTSRPRQVLKRLEEEGFDLLISDIKMPGLDGFALLQQVKQAYPLLPIIMLTSHGTIADAVRAIQAGAYDYLSKPISRDDLHLKIKRALKNSLLLRDNIGLRAELAAHYGIRNMVGQSKPMKTVFRKIAKVAPTGASVLIMGESGTGKELAARAIHYKSPRRDLPFIPIDFAALPPTLLESELFGHVKGAFTGAYKDREGAFELAREGTLFFDEIGDMDISLQSKLLRVLQERTFKRVGDNRNRGLAARLLFGTHRDLSREMSAHSFREDLYYRIAVIPITLPPLRERREDIPLLIKYFLKKSCKRHSLSIKVITPAAVKTLSRYPWKGNVRELENIIENLVVMGEGETITIHDLFPASAPGSTAAVGQSLAQVEKEYILKTLKSTGGNRSQTARLLGISLRGLRYKLKRYNSQFPEKQPVSTR